MIYDLLNALIDEAIAMDSAYSEFGNYGDYEDLHRLARRIRDGEIKPTEQLKTLLKVN